MAEYNDAKVITTQTAEDLDGVLEYHVEGKYEGTDQDKLDMKVLGRSQETRRMFTWITMLGFGSTLIVTWEALLASMGAIITNGGTAGMFWGFLIVIAGYLMVYSSIAEMASMVSELSAIGNGRWEEYDLIHTLLSGCNLRRSVPLGVRVRPSIDTEVPQLRDGLAWLHRMAVGYHCSRISYRLCYPSSCHFELSFICCRTLACLPHNHLCCHDLHSF